MPQLAEKPFVLGTSYDDGLGIRLGMSVAAGVRHMDEAFLTAPAGAGVWLLAGGGVVAAAGLLTWIWRRRHRAQAVGIEPSGSREHVTAG